MILVLCLLFVGMGMAYNQAPVLEKLVSDGELPPVDERLPVDPLVLETFEEVGQYGGEVVLVASSLKGFGSDLHFTAFQTPAQLYTDTTVGPNVFTGWEIGEDGKTLTIDLREGIKWSDGEDFTVDDILFWWNDEVNNTALVSSVYIPEFVDAQMEKIDDYTFNLIFAEELPNLQIEMLLATQWGYLGKWWRPEHFLKQFNPNYVAEDELLEMAKAEGYDTVRDFYYSKAGWSARQINPECPSINAYVLISLSPDIAVWERNPYFWKVDQEGNQLPYIDKVIVRKIDDLETIQGQIISGEVDFACWNTTLENYPLYKTNEEAGGYKTLLWQSDRGAEVMFMPNENIEEDHLRVLFQNPKFRQALSLAINREEINDLLYFGKAVPRQFTVHPSSNYYEEEWAESYAEYDPEKANELLDEIGLENKDDQGFRVDENGNRISFVLEYWPEEPAEKTPISELVKDYWEAVGIQMSLKPQSRDLNAQRSEANQIEMNMWHGGGVTDASWVSTLNPPLPYPGINWAPEWGEWFYTAGQEGMEPPEDIKALYELGKAFQKEADPEKKLEMGKEIWQMQAENLWFIGTVGMAPYPIIINENLGNVPETGIYSGDLLWMDTYQPETFFLKQ